MSDYTITAQVTLPRAVLDAMSNEDLRALEVEVSKRVQAEFERREMLMLYMGDGQKRPQLEFPELAP